MFEYVIGDGFEYGTVSLATWPLLRDECKQIAMENERADNPTVGTNGKTRPQFRNIEGIPGTHRSKNPTACVYAAKDGRRPCTDDETEMWKGLLLSLPTAEAIEDDGEHCVATTNVGELRPCTADEQSHMTDHRNEAPTNDPSGK